MPNLFEDNKFENALNLFIDNEDSNNSSCSQPKLNTKISTLLLNYKEEIVSFSQKKKHNDSSSPNGNLSSSDENNDNAISTSQNSNKMFKEKITQVSFKDHLFLNKHVNKEKLKF